MTSRSWYRGFEAAGIVGDRRNLGGPLASMRLPIVADGSMPEADPAFANCYPKGVCDNLDNLLRPMMPALV